MMRSKTMALCAAVCVSALALASCNQNQQASNQPAQPPAAETPAAPAAPAAQQAGDLSQAANDKYIADNGKKTGVTTTPSGLQYRVIKKGAGKSPKVSDNVTVTYKGWLINGDVFDQTQGGQTATFPAGALIPGWVEALQLMKEGDEWEITIPSKLGYGEQGAPGAIPPNQTLVFNMALMKVN